MQFVPLNNRRPRSSLLMTGATGMVGSCVLARLMRTGQDCAVIVRDRRQGRSIVSAADRIDRILGVFEGHWECQLRRPRVLRGDLHSNDLGLTADELNWVSLHCDRLLHSAASLSFAPASESESNEPYRTNVDGTKAVLDLAERCEIDQFHHVSTAYVCGKRSGDVLESELDVGQSFANDYEQSKVQAETLIRERWPTDKLTIFRPSIVIDPLGLTPVSGDRTIYGAHAVYKMLASRFGLPDDGQWFRNLGFQGDERKNLIDVHWIAQAIEVVLTDQRFHGCTYHLTANEGTLIRELDHAFRVSTQRYLQQRPGLDTDRVSKSRSIGSGAEVADEIDKIAAPFVNTFLPYFRDDPQFDRRQINHVVMQSELPPPPTIRSECLLQMINNWSSPAKPKRKAIGVHLSGGENDIVICGYEVRLPGGVDNAKEFEHLLYESRSAINSLPPDRLNRELYLDDNPGKPGKTYTQIGGCVSPEPLDPSVEVQIQSLGQFDLTHRQFAQVAVAAMRACFDRAERKGSEFVDPTRAGVFVGHSGGTESGGPLSLATLAESATRFLIDQTPLASAEEIGVTERDLIRRQVVEAIRMDRPKRDATHAPEFNAYAAASLASRLLDFRGRREVVDAACSSSLIALHHAATAIGNGQLDLAVVGGATFNNVDNLALFSQTRACSASGSYPFDERASGLVSSEGYVAVVIARREVASRAGLPVLAALQGVGLSSDGKGKGLWAPRSEGQQLAMRRAYHSNQCPLDIDYLECHATSTQVGDATELSSLDALLQERSGKLPIGSVKSNLGHLLEAAGLVGLVKCLIAMERGKIPPSINFHRPSKSHDWDQSAVRVVDKVQKWESRKSVAEQNGSTNDRPDGLRVAGVNAFGIGGLNAHAVIQIGSSSPPRRVSKNDRSAEPIAIVARGLVLPGAGNVSQFAERLASGRSVLGDPPPGRWPWQSKPGSGANSAIGIGSGAGPFEIPHAVGGYITGFHFDAQCYRIPPKVVANANPAQLMLIEAVRQAIEELNGGLASIDRKRTAVTIGTMFGGQFSNELQIGLRLPEIEKHLIQAARRQGVSAEASRQWADSYRKAALQHYPALLDETGGFTASTLASRIARTFDLMGGACAVDADEASSSLALMTAAEQLRAGDVDTVICGTAQRSLDLVALEQLYRTGRLCPSPQIDDLQSYPGTVFPAEGVAVIVLQRLSDARRHPRRILGLIDSFDECLVESPRECDTAGGANDQRHDPFCSVSIVKTMGHLGGGHGLVQTIAATLANEAKSAAAGPRLIQETANDGYQVRFRISPFKPPAMDLASAKTRQPASLATLCITAPDREQLRQRLSDWIDGRQGIGSLSIDDSARREPCAAVMVTPTGDELALAARALLEGPVAKGKSGVLSKHAAFCKLDNVTGDRTAWTFPGQGSQYAAIPKLFQVDPECQHMIQTFDDVMVTKGLEPVGPRLEDPEQQLGRDIWWTQAWLLAIGTTMTESLLRRGDRPDVVLGHSFGECTAAWAAGVMDTEQAIDFAVSRSNSVALCGGPRGQLLSVRAELSRVTAVLHGCGSACAITHHNSPCQTVVAGQPGEIADAKQALHTAGIPSVVISVPVAFHTPAMSDAREVLKSQQSDARYRPPRFAFLSATQTRYLAEPDDIKANLVDQLIRPVGFCGAIERLVKDGCGLILEVGPSNVLTKLATATAGGNAICLSADHPNWNAGCNRELVRLAGQLFGSRSSRPDARPAAAVTTQSTLAASSKSSFEIIDVTRRARREQVSRMPVEAKRDSVQVAADVKPPDTNRVSAHSADTFAVKTDRLHDDWASESPLSKATVQSARTSRQESSTVIADTASAKKFLFDLVVDLTGYEPEIIDFGADLESELGIDSIKKAQLIGELAQWAKLELTTADVRLGDYQSMADILGLIPDSQDASTAKVFADPQADSITPSPFSQPDVDADDLQRLMIDLIVEQTGYDESIIEMDADLESELGIDSIKRAQLLGELEQQFQLPPIEHSQLKLADFPTLQSIHAFIMDQVGGQKKKTVDSSETRSHTRPSAEQLGRAKIDTAGQTIDPAPVVAPDVPATGTHRFTLRLKTSEHLPGMPSSPNFYGNALVIGENSVADALVKQLRVDGIGVRAIRSESSSTIDAALDAVWHDGVTPNLFLTTCHDADSMWRVDDPDAFWRRRESAIDVPYRICQRWMQQTIDAGLMDRARLVTVLRGGGVFGLNRNSAATRSEVSNESGVMAGLTKAMLIEAWMRGFRETPMLVVDIPSHATPQQIVDGVWRELAVPSYDEEVVVGGQPRKVLAVHHSPLTKSSADETRYPLTRGGAWVVAGGGRGITAMTAMALAQRYGLRLHLLGMAPVPEVDDATRHQAQVDCMELRRETMRRVQAEGRNPVKHWRQFEKAIEIDLTLQECRRRGIDATYHSVDISDVVSTEHTLEQIRATSGPIRGVIQGAGSGQDARFDRKRPDKVRQCLSAKIDGTISLANATRQDPLEWFVGFGSISGRFGANGHTDYSAANEMLAKTIGDLGSLRPETRCLTFHWHAWGDVGMATKPEAKLALKMIGMEFMPAAEGLQHFLREIESGGDASEVLFTDRRYVRKFIIGGEDDRPFAAPLIAPNRRADEVHSVHDSACHTVTLDPTRDAFLVEHQSRGKPTLPIVIAAEMMAQAARLSRLSQSESAEQRIRLIRGLRALAPLKANSDDAFAVEVHRDPEDASNYFLACDLRRRDGRMVEAARRHFQARIEFTSDDRVRKVTSAEHLRFLDIDQKRVEYLPPEAPIYHGPPLRCLRTIGFSVDPGSASIPIAVGTIVAPSPSHLVGEDCPLTGWVTCPATMDAVLYAAGVLAGQVGQRASLPITIDKIELGRLPQPGEPLRVVVKWLVDSEDGRGGVLSAILVGLNDDLIAELTGYRIGWLG